MHADDYQTLALRTKPEFSATLLSASTMMLLNGLIGLSGESGEALDELKKELFQGHSRDVDKLAKELGDIAWYLALSTFAIGMDLSDVMQMNIEKLRERYPEGFDAERSIGRE